MRTSCRFRRAPGRPLACAGARREARFPSETPPCGSPLRSKSKLYRFDNDSGEWKERGVGQSKLLQHKESQRIRYLFRQEKTLKIRANHIGECRLTDQGRGESMPLKLAPPPSPRCPPARPLWRLHPPTSASPPCPRAAQ
jgi:hypothetical protein